jgi:hypothetical protein
MQSQGWLEVTLRHSWGLLSQGPLRRRIAAFLLLPWREIFLYLSPHALPAGVISLIKRGCCTSYFYLLLAIGEQRVAVVRALRRSHQEARAFLQPLCTLTASAHLLASVYAMHLQVSCS